MAHRSLAYGGVFAGLLAACSLVVACGERAAPPESAPVPTLAAPRTVASPDAAAPAPRTDSGMVVNLLPADKLDVDGTVTDEAGLRQAFAKDRTDDTVLIRASADTPWARVIHALDLMKQSKNGDRPFAFAVGDGEGRRTSTLRFPRAGKMAQLPFPPLAGRGQSAPTGGSAVATIVSVAISHDGDILVDGKRLAGALREYLAVAVTVTTPLDASPDLLLVVNADARASFGTVVDVTRDGQSVGAKIAFAVAAAALGPSSERGPRARTPAALAKCPFPAASDKANIDQATVNLKVAVDAKGRVTSVSVVNDPGYGFGSAAKACAAKATWDAALDGNGNEVAGEAVLRMLFTR